MLWFLTGEVLLEDVELVVLPDAARGSGDEVLCGGTVAKGRLLVESPHVLLDFSWLRGIKLGGPAAGIMFHTSVLSRDSLGVYLNSNVVSKTLRFILKFTYTVLGHLWDVVEDDLVWVPKTVILSRVLILVERTDNTSLGVLEQSVTTKLLSFFLILVLFCHLMRRFASF